MATYKELVQQIEKLQQQAENLRKKELQDVIAEVKAKIQQYGLSAFDLGLARGKSKSSAKGTVKPKYKNPATGKTWTGRGRAPKWIVEAEEAGKKRESFRI